MSNKLFLTLCIFLVSYAAKSQEDTLLVNDSFEDSIYKKNWKGIQACCLYSLQRSDSVARDGKYSLKAELNSADPLVSKGRRAELATKGVDMFSKWSYAFSTYLPGTYPTDSSYEIVAQWHEVADKDLGESSRTPPISVQISKGRWILSIRWATDAVNTNKSISGSKKIDLGEATKDVWTDWKFIIYFSYDSNGCLDVWKNNEPFVQYEGPNYYNDKRGPYFKIGLYKSQWNNPIPKVSISRRVIYFDNIVISKAL